MIKKYISKSEKEWRKSLTPKEFHILREKGTESPFSGKYVYNKEKGLYVCSGCENELFSSENKFDSGSGWPSFWDVVSSSKVELKPDYNHGMQRIEVLCSKFQESKIAVKIYKMKFLVFLDIFDGIPLLDRILLQV